MKKMSKKLTKALRMIDLRGQFNWHSFRRTDGPVTVGLDGYEFYTKTGDLGPGSVNVYINEGLTTLMVVTSVTERSGPTDLEASPMTAKSTITVPKWERS